MTICRCRYVCDFKITQIWKYCRIVERIHLASTRSIHYCHKISRQKTIQRICLPKLWFIRQEDWRDGVQSIWYLKIEQRYHQKKLVSSKATDAIQQWIEFNHSLCYTLLALILSLATAEYWRNAAWRSSHDINDNSTKQSNHNKIYNWCNAYVFWFTQWSRWNNIMSYPTFYACHYLHATNKVFCTMCIDSGWWSEYWQNNWQVCVFSVRFHFNDAWMYTFLETQFWIPTRLPFGVMRVHLGQMYTNYFKMPQF